MSERIFLSSPHMSDEGYEQQFVTVNDLGNKRKKPIRLGFLFLNKKK